MENPTKKEYRHYNIKTVEGPDDFASMEEVVYRRYKRLLEEKKSLPQLIIVDGGKGQLSSALKKYRSFRVEGGNCYCWDCKKIRRDLFP